MYLLEHRFDILSWIFSSRITHKYIECLIIFHSTNIQWYFWLSLSLIKERDHILMPWTHSCYGICLLDASKSLNVSYIIQWQKRPLGWWAHECSPTAGHELSISEEIMSNTQSEHWVGGSPGVKERRASVTLT